MSFKRFIRFPEHDEKHDEQMTRYLRFISVVKPVGTMKGWGWGTSKGFQYPAVPLSRCACARLFRINWRPVSPASLSRRSLLPYRYKNVRTVFFPSSHPTNFSHLPTFLLYIAPSPLQGLRPGHCPRLPRIIALGFSTLHLPPPPSYLRSDDIFPIPFEKVQFFFFCIFFLFFFIPATIPSPGFFFLAFRPLRRPWPTLTSSHDIPSGTTGAFVNCNSGGHLHQNKPPPSPDLPEFYEP